jgi:hypothetical protein
MTDEQVTEVEEQTAEGSEELAIAEELAGELRGDTDVLAGIVGDEFALEMISPWGDRWIWVKIDAEQAQEIYKLLGEPVFQQAELEANGTVEPAEESSEA